MIARCNKVQYTMTVHFAAARSAAVCAPVARVLSRRAPARHANDDGPASDRARLADDLLLQQALRHFALHGMNAADDAMRKAADALQAGDVASFRRWTDICSKFDRRAAARLEVWADQQGQP